MFLGSSLYQQLGFSSLSFQDCPSGQCRIRVPTSRVPFCLVRLDHFTIFRLPHFRIVALTILATWHGLALRCRVLIPRSNPVLFIQRVALSRCFCIGFFDPASIYALRVRVFNVILDGVSCRGAGSRQAIYSRCERTHAP